MGTSEGSVQQDERPNVFSWGYWGWGSTTRDFVALADAVERARGFEPPLFVDIRLKRKVRATGFRDEAFAETAGPERYVWMPDLGNKAIDDARATGVQIARPEAAVDLLALVNKARSERRRVIFFCACEFPAYCHRSEVARLLIAAGKVSSSPVLVQEWPGGEPRAVELEVPVQVVKGLRGPARSMPVDAGLMPLAELGALAWGSVVTARAGHMIARFVAGRCERSSSGWSLPVVQIEEPETSVGDLTQLSAELRRGTLFDPWVNGDEAAAFVGNDDQGNDDDAGDEPVKVVTIGLQREKGYVYWIEEDGVWCAPKKNEHEARLIIKRKIEDMSRRWTYFLDADGDISRVASDLGVDDDDLSSPVTGSPRSWVFKAKKSEIDFEQYLEPGLRYTWRAETPPADWKSGDRIFLWSSTLKAVVGVATFTGVRAPATDEELCEFQLRCDTPFFEEPLEADLLKEEPILAKADFLKSRSSEDVIALDTDQAEALLRLIAEHAGTDAA